MKQLCKVALCLLLTVGVSGCVLPVLAAVKHPRPQSPAPGQTSAPSAEISFDPSTHYTDGTAIPSDKIVAYDLYQGVKGEEKLLVATITETATTVTTGLQYATEYCWHVIAVVDQVQSEPSNEACKQMGPAPAPNPVTITVL